ncbi:glycosyltransferase family 2 protein [Christiangramia forsetii]|uniref:TuaG-like glycosyl transferase n=2 Tax=Christiangramia forsetii TaxID=411153 RepID=A0M6I2_CHRFK|nr:glycosyltransferase family 2 protein [Christiangramia forsetii]GGG30356.1 glycosyl transferase [Christiangramia forsetii]CAL68227.1 TuaG-like glycosyl transferase [Christiangramia forsetii KT0803]
MEDRGLVSVIMPAYNSEVFITESIQSVIRQTYPNWELLIIDDASSDTTKQIVQKFSSEDERIKLLKNSTNAGTHHSRNKGIKAASGNFIAFLDADDQWKPQKLEKQLKVLSKPNVAACFSSYELINEKGASLQKKIQALPVLDYDKLLKANYVGNLTGIYNVSILGKVYCPDIPKRQDWALWLKVIEEGGPIEGIAESLAVYRIRKNSISTNKLEMLKYNFKVYHSVLKYGFFHSIWRMLIFLNEQFFVKSKQVRAISNEK